MSKNPRLTDWYRSIHEVAAVAHMHQVDKGGEPYVRYLGRVVDRLLCRWPDATKSQVQVALLHDIIEDGQIGGTKLASVADDHVMVTVHLVTNPKTMSYLDYIKTIADSGNLDAIRVKLADNEDNSNPSPAHPQHVEMFERKYRPAKALLEQSLRKLETGDE